MIDISKFKHEHGVCINIRTDEGIFYIDYGGNLDLYWGYRYKNSILDDDNEKKFIITKENYYLYSLFLELFDGVKNSTVYILDQWEEKMYDEEEIRDKKELHRKWNKQIAQSEKYNPNRLFKNNTIEWHSDDFCYEDGSILKIEKKRECFVITFIKSKNDDIYSTSSVRLRNNGSLYDPFNILFMRMYANLVRNYNPDFHQVHIEEVLYKKRKKNH